MTGVILLSKAVQDILVKTRSPLSDYFRYLSLAAEAVTKLRLHTVSYPRQVRIEMNDAGIVAFPVDMLQFISIGAAVKGALWTYTYRGDIIMTTEDDVPEETLERELTQYPPTSRGGKNTHYFRIDYENRQIFVMGFPQQDVYLTYTSSGISLTSPTYIPLEMVPAIRAYVLWEDAKYNTSIHPSQKDRYEYYFHQERKLLQSLREPTVDQWADAIRKTYSRAVIR